MTSRPEMMNSRHIDRIINLYVRWFDGVCSSEDLPQRRSPKLLVANTDPAYLPGEHWIAMFIDERGNGQYFDSFGRPPSKMFWCYLNEHCKRWTQNTTQYQRVISELCGQYCVVWCMLNSRKLDLCYILSSSDTGLNDTTIRHIVIRMYCSQLLWSS